MKQLTLLKIIILIKYCCLFLFSISLFSQEVNIPTQFSIDGSLYKKLDKNLNQLSEPIADFSETQECFVLEYLGRDNYRVKYKEWVGIVAVDFLEVNEDMMDLYYVYQETARTKAIEVKADRQRKIREIAEEKEEEERLIREKFVRDSIAKIVEKQRVIRVQFVKDSISKVVAEQKVIRESFVKDSMSKVISRQKAVRNQFIKDSTLRALAKQEFIRDQFVKDSITRVITQQQTIRNQFIRDSIAEIMQERRLRRERFVNDSISKVVAEQKVIRNQYIRDSIAQSISKVKKGSDDLKIEEKGSLSLEFRNTCHYTINEFDPFYNVKTVRTEAYKIAEALTIELYKQGRKTNVFINSKEDLGCVSYFTNNRSSTKITLENNQVVSFYHSWDMECGQFLFKGNLSQSQMNILKKSPIKSIRLRGTKGSKEVIEIAYKEFFMDKLKCLEE